MPNDYLEFVASKVDEAWSEGRENGNECYPRRGHAVGPPMTEAVKSDGGIGGAIEGAGWDHRRAVEGLAE